MAAVCVQIPEEETPSDTDSSESESTAESESSASRTGVPLTVVTGFLGSGKSTLLNNLLSSLVASSMRVAIVQNEFGASGVEEDFSAASAVDSEGVAFSNVVELGGGCICCSVKGSLLAAVELLAEERGYDYILVECSGAADPVPIIELFWVDADLQSSIYLDSLICVCDAHHFVSDSLDSAKRSILTRQLAFADSIILNKIDLVSSSSVSVAGLSGASGTQQSDDATIACIRKTVRQMNTVASIFLTTRCSVPLESVLFKRCYDNAPLSETLSQLSASAKCSKCETDGDCIGHLHAASGSVKQCAHSKSGVTNVVFTEKNKVIADSDSVEAWLCDLLWKDTTVSGDQLLMEQKTKEGMAIWRLKGILLGADGYKYFVQCVQELFEVTKSSEKWTDADECRVVVIGVHLDEAYLLKTFETVLVSQ